jgi:microsomal dipeptidase-like Zn-dependent dipeptidase
MRFKYADIHLHTSLKPYYCSKYPSGAVKTIWDKFPERKKDLRKISFIIRNLSKELAKSSQANLDACVEANLTCPFFALYPAERQWFDVQLRRDPHGKFLPELMKLVYRIFLPRWKYHHLGSAFSGFPTEFVSKIMKRIKRGEGIDYFNDELLPLMDFTLNQLNTRSKIYPYYSFKIATDYREFKAFTSEANTICSIITVEGGNSLGNYPYHKIFYKEYNQLDNNEKDSLRNDFTNNVQTLKNWNGGRYTPFFISFCHHFNNLLAGHSKSLAAFRGLLNQEPALDKGINPLGMLILDLLLSRDNGRRILIDTKHMSVQSRKEYHRIVRGRRENNDPVPIIQSHAAISGVASFNDALLCDEKDPGFDKETYFSKWKVNINDEEILDIYDSKGIIGIVFHEDRMPGGKVKAQTRELSDRYHKLERKKHLSFRQEEEFSEIKLKLKYIYVQLIWSNIFHIIRLIYNNRSENGWRIVCIGSDYDGMIDPFDGYFSVSDLPSLFNDMTEYINMGRGPIYYADNGNIREFQGSEIQRLMFGKPIEDIMRDICFNNVDGFLKDNFS